MIRVRFLDVQRNYQHSMFFLGVRKKFCQTGLPRDQENKFFRVIENCYFETSDKNPDLIVWPYGKLRSRDIDYLNGIKSTTDSQVVAFDETDNPRRFRSANFHIFRTSGYNSCLGVHEKILPAFCADPRGELLDNKITTECDFPESHIGFCGYVASPLNVLMFMSMLRLEKAKGLRIRQKVIRAFLYIDGINPRFVVRHKFRNGLIGDVHRIAGKASRNEFLEIIINTRTSLAMRGAGNFSYRFYESLACGRPVIWVCSDEALPFGAQELVEECIFPLKYPILQLELERLCDRIRSMTPAEWNRRCVAARQLWESYFSAEGFFSNSFPRLFNNMSEGL